MRRSAYCALALGLLVMAPGCRLCEKCRLFKRSDNARLDAPAPAHGGADPLLIPPPAGGLPTPPAPTFDSPRSGDLPPPSLPDTRNYMPQEKKNGKELLLPDPLPGESSSKGRGYLEGPAEVRKSDSTTAKTLTKEKETPAKTVNGIPGFVQVREGLATGRKPSIEGFDGLKSASYKTVVYLHAGNSDVSAAKALAETRGLEFIAVPVTADKAKAAYTRFAELLNDSTAKPMYIFDDEGLRTGCLWYASFRSVDGLSDDAAQVRAAPLGLRDSTGSEKAKLLAAVQDFLAKR